MLCPEHSKVELFIQLQKQINIDQWKAIDGIRRAAWATAIGALGTLVVMLVTIIFKQVGIF